MDKKLKLAIIIAAVVLLGLLVATLVLVLSDGKNAPDPSQLPEATVDGAAPQDGSQAPEEELASSQQPAASNPDDDLIPADPSEETPQPVGTQNASGTEAPPATVSPSTQKPSQNPGQSKEISFPYTIPGSSLVISKIDSYNGIFLEDGSDRSVSGICTLVLSNIGTTDVEYADISIQQGSRSLLFKTTVLRAGCTVVVQEANAAAYAEGAYTGCTADVAEVAKLEMSADKVQILENTDGSLTVTNLTNQAIGGIRIFYKFCLTKGSVYVGGITYTAKVENLAPGGTQTVIPNHFSYGSSEVVMVRLYDSL